MVFQGEDVPLEKDILRKKEDFVKSWLEWAAQNRLQIFRDASSRSSTTTIFTVPKNETLFITSCFIDNIFNGSAVSGINASLNIPGEDNTLLGTAIRLGVASHTFMALSLPMPVKVESGGTVRITSGSNNRVSGGFHGFVVPKRIT